MFATIKKADVLPNNDASWHKRWHLDRNWQYLWLSYQKRVRKQKGKILHFLLLARYVPNVAKEEYMRSV